MIFRHASFVVNLNIALEITLLSFMIIFKEESMYIENLE